MNVMEELIRKMIADLRKQVAEKVPEVGEFPVVYERYENPDKSLDLSHIILKVSDVSVKGSEDKRYLEIAVVNYPSPYGSESVVGYGTTQDILDRLQEEALANDIVKKIHKMERELED